MFLYVQFCDDVPFYVGITNDRYNRPLYFGCAHNKLYKQFIIENSHKNFRTEVTEVDDNLAENSEYVKVKELVGKGYKLMNIYKHEHNKHLSTRTPHLEPKPIKPAKPAKRKFSRGWYST